MRTPLLAFGLTAALPMLVVGQDLPAQTEGDEQGSELALVDDASVILAQRANCRDMVRHVREEQGLPRLRRESASPDEPMLIATVDYDFDGCDVLLTSEGPRALPEFDEGATRLYPAQ